MEGGKVVKGILNETFHFMDTSFGDVEEHLLIRFDKGDEVEILKVIDNAHSFESEIAYVIFNIKNNESITIDSGLVDLINE